MTFLITWSQLGNLLGNATFFCTSNLPELVNESLYFLGIKTAVKLFICQKTDEDLRRHSVLLRQHYMLTCNHPHPH